ncbi:hypothetical protein [Streptomyces sp. NPDC002088]
MTTLAIPIHRTTSHRASGRDRAMTLTLGANSCVLSYDALRGGK